MKDKIPLSISILSAIRILDWNQIVLLQTQGWVDIRIEKFNNSYVCSQVWWWQETINLSNYITTLSMNEFQWKGK